MQTTIECGELSPAAWAHAVKPAWSFPMLEVLMKSLTPIEEIWAGLPDGDAIAQLERREDLLGVATVPCRALELLYEVITDFGIANMIRRHPPSVTAAAKQALLDSDRQSPKLLVNKTVTVRLGTSYVLCTGAGDFTLNRCLLSQVANRLGLSNRVVKACRINPPEYSPEYELGLLTGMVSPFFVRSMSSKRLQSVVRFDGADAGAVRGEMVAISLSPFESLIVPVAEFGVLVDTFVARAHPGLLRARIAG